MPRPCGHGWDSIVLGSDELNTRALSTLPLRLMVSKVSMISKGTVDLEVIFGWLDGGLRHDDDGVLETRGNNPWSSNDNKRRSLSTGLEWAVSSGRLHEEG